jgi:hypothetical protein
VFEASETEENNLEKRPIFWSVCSDTKASAIMKKLHHKAQPNPRTRAILQMKGMFQSGKGERLPARRKMKCVVWLVEQRRRVRYYLFIPVPLQVTPDDDKKTRGRYQHNKHIRRPLRLGPYCKSIGFFLRLHIFLFLLVLAFQEVGSTLGIGFYSPRPLLVPPRGLKGGIAIYEV